MPIFASISIIYKIIAIVHYDDYLPLMNKVKSIRIFVCWNFIVTYVFFYGIMHLQFDHFHIKLRQMSQIDVMKKKK